MGTHGHQHKLTVQIVLPQEYFSFRSILCQPYVTRHTNARTENVAAVLALQCYLSLSLVDESEVSLLRISSAVNVVHQTMRRGMHGFAGGQVDNTEYLAIGNILAAVSLGLVHSEVIKLSITTILSVLVKGKQGMART